MKKALTKSRAITELEEKITQHGNMAVEEFLNDLKKKGAPIIEEIENDDRNNLVTFIYKGDEECKSVLFVPDIGVDRFGDYSAFKMEKLYGTELWCITYEIENDMRFIYYFSPDDPLDDDWNSRFGRVKYDVFCKRFLNFDEENVEDKGSYVIMPKSPEDFWTKKREGTAEGKIDEYRFESKNLEDKRRVRVYTPHGYDKSGKPYGYMVLNDGNDYIDTLSAVDTLNNLIADNKIPPIVAVFIDSTNNRGKELKCNDSFCDVIVKEIIPWARQNYNITSSPEDSIIGGLSLGGLTAAYIGLKYPDIFGNVLSQSGYFIYEPEGFIKNNDDCWMSTLYKQAGKLPHKFYLDMGVLETKYKIIDTNLNFRDTLIAMGCEVDLRWFNGGHDYLSWGETFAYGLISLIGTKQQAGTVL